MLSKVGTGTPVKYGSRANRGLTRSWAGADAPPMMSPLT